MNNRLTLGNEMIMRQKLPNHMSLEVYHDTVSRAQAKANLFDQTVAIVIGPTWCELVLCPGRGNTNEPDMTRVNELLASDEKAELLEVVGVDIE